MIHCAYYGWSQQTNTFQKNTLLPVLISQSIAVKPILQLRGMHSSRYLWRGVWVEITYWVLRNSAAKWIKFNFITTAFNHPLNGNWNLFGAIKRISCLLIEMFLKKNYSIWLFYILSREYLKFWSSGRRSQLLYRQSSFLGWFCDWCNRCRISCCVIHVALLTGCIEKEMTKQLLAS